MRWRRRRDSVCGPMSKDSPEPDVDALMEQFHAYLRKKRLKSTKQRDLIAETFFGSPGHLSVEDLLSRVRVGHPGMGYATVYRTLKLLTECGLAAERRFDETPATYETTGDAEHHDHLICMECGHVLEFHSEEIENAQELMARSFGFSIVRHRHELYGMCAKARGIKNGSCPADDARAK